MGRLSFVALTTIVAGLIACSSAPTPPRPVPTLSPSRPAPTAASRAPTAPPLARFEDDEIVFEYPAEWDVAVFPRHRRLRPIAYLSPQPMTDPCTRTVNSVTCSGMAVGSLDPASVLVQWDWFTTPGGNDSTPPEGARHTLLGGRHAFLLESDHNTCGTVSGDQSISLLMRPWRGWWLRMTACIRGPGEDVVEAQVNAMLASVEWRPQEPDLNRIVPTHHLEELQRGLGTRTGIIGGQLVDRGNCVYLVLPSREWLVIWPSGTSVDEAQDPRVIRDPGGEEVARIGEAYSMGGLSFPAESIDEVAPVLDEPVPEWCRDAEILLADPDLRPLESRAVTWRLDESSSPDAHDTTVDINFRERWCPGNLDPYPRLQPTRPEYFTDRIVITLPVLEITGRCMELPDHPLTVPLHEPVGDRDLVDGSSGAVRWHDGAAVSPAPDE